MGDKGFSVVEDGDEATYLAAHDVRDGDEVVLPFGPLLVVESFHRGIMQQRADGDLKKRGAGHLSAAFGHADGALPFTRLTRSWVTAPLCLQPVGDLALLALGAPGRGEEADDNRRSFLAEAGNRADQFHRIGIARLLERRTQRGSKGGELYT